MGDAIVIRQDNSLLSNNFVLREFINTSKGLVVKLPWDQCFRFGRRMTNLILEPNLYKILEYLACRRITRIRVVVKGGSRARKRGQ